ncbi:50S ribosomal protein L11 methyltransferase [Alphaproteobacteria bacterium]|nr:50S ribosomal protein L11 methyltransferase [Alphaproteobacteria bacterium]
MPAALEEGQIALIGQVFEDFTNAFVALREGNQPSGDWELEWICAVSPDQIELSRRLSIGLDICGFTAVDASWVIEAVAEKNWLEESYKQFPPFEVGPFFIYGSHYEGDVPADQMGLQIDAATAFGTGEHGTTKGCLEFMLRLKDEGACPWNVLDMGCGSGILAIAAWKLWKTPILAVDIEEESVRVSKVHQDMNGVSDAGSAMTCLHGDGFDTGDVQAKKPFDLVIANILAGPLIEMAADCKAVADENGYVILSGMLVEQAQSVRAAYEAQGIRFIDQIDIGEWASLLLQNAAA